MKPGTKLTQEIKAFITERGADLVGVAPMERFAECPDETKPQAYMPGAKSVISVGMNLANGVCDVWGEYTEEGKSISPYLFYGYGLTNLETSRIVNAAAKKLEKMGHKALLFPPTWLICNYRFFERSLMGDMLGDFSHRHAAVAAGLAEIGWNGLAMTPEYGVRVRWNSIITDAPLTPDPLYDGPPVCQPDKCDKQCARLCPSEAFSETETITASFGDKKCEYAKLDKIRCMYSIVGLTDGSGGRTKMKLPDGPGDAMHLMEAREKEVSPVDKLMLDQCFGIITGDFCGKCLHHCPAHKFKK